MNSEQPPLLALRQTNVSRPQLQHSDSAQSISASEDYFSVSEPVSDESDDRSKLTVIRYETPPSRYRTPQQSHEHLLPEASTLAGRPVKRQPPSSLAAAVEAAGQNEPQSSLQAPPPAKVTTRQAMDPESPATTPGIDDTPYIRFAIDQLTRDEEVRGSRYYAGADISDDEYPVERIIPDEGLGYTAQSKGKVPPPPRSPKRPVGKASPLVQRDIFVPYTPAENEPQFPPLNFKPAILRPLLLLPFIFLVLAVTVGLIFSAVWSERNHGLWDYAEFGGSRYFVFQYLPTIFGMVVLLWLFQIQIAVQRIAPFAALASPASRSRTEASFLPIHASQFLLPQLHYFKAGQASLGVFSVISWLFIFTVPLLPSSFNVRYQEAAGGRWRWVAVQGAVWAAAGLYILLALALITVFGFFFRRDTGLRWDPRSLADICALLERTNIMKDYTDSETFATERDFRERLSTRTDRLGYWHTSRRPKDIFYGIGEPGGPTRQYSIEQGRIREKDADRDHPNIKAGPEVKRHPGDFSIRMDIRSARLRQRYLPWYLKDTFVIAWIVIAIVLVIAFLVISFVNNAVRDGFLPLLPALATTDGFSASNFLYSFVPSIIATILFLSWQAFDLTLRALQPYTELSAPGGAPALRSLLLDYPARQPLSCTLAALSNSHYRVAFVSVVTLTNAALPVLAGGAFWTQYYPGSNSVRVAAHLPAYYALCALLSLHAIAHFALFPGRRRAALPHRSRTLAETVSWVYQSPLLADRAFARPQTKVDLVTRLVGSDPAPASSWSRSFTALVTPSKRSLRPNNNGAHGLTISRPIPEAAGPSSSAPGVQRPRPSTEAQRKEWGGDPPSASRPSTADQIPPHLRTASPSRRTTAGEKRQSVLDPGAIRYGFGVFVGRDGREHLGVDRCYRGPGRELVQFDARGGRRGGGWLDAHV